MPTALIVSHGQPSDPEIGEAELAAFAARVAAYAPNIRVVSATLATPGKVERLAAQLPPDTLVYPLFMADGWFTKVNLPKRLGDSGLNIAPPFGCDAGLAQFGAGWMRDIVTRNGWAFEDTTLVVVGHGSGRSDRPAAVTRAFADAVQADLAFTDMRVGFVEEDPRLADVLAGLNWRAICLPFFAARRGHVLDDLPEAVAESGFGGIVLPPIGLHPCTPGFIALRLAALLEDTPTSQVA